MPKRKNTSNLSLLSKEFNHLYTRVTKKLSAFIIVTTTGTLIIKTGMTICDINFKSNLKTYNESSIVAYNDNSDIYDLDKLNIFGVKPEFKEYSHDAKEISTMLINHKNAINEEKIVFLTFDDGASNTVTPKILDILDKYNIKATFFINGKTTYEGGDIAKRLVKRAFDSGHAIGNHSYSHDYKFLFPNRTANIENLKEDLIKNEEFLKSILGDDFTTRIVRCPGGVSSWNNSDQIYDFFKENDLVCIDWNALSGDSELGYKDTTHLIERTKETSKDKNIVVILMHDTYGKERSALALESIIKYYQTNGYTFKTLS